MSGTSYRAVFENKNGSVTSGYATLTVTVPASAPQVTMNPSSASVVAGSSAPFTAAATGNPTPTVQWQVSTDNGGTWNNVSGATSTTLLVTGATVAMSGNEYRAVFTNSVSAATTTAAVLTVTAALATPVVTSNPSDQSVANGQSVSFDAAASGNPAPSVQWQYCSSRCNKDWHWHDLSGATSTTLTFDADGTEDGNQYHAVFTNGEGSATTDAATLTVTSAPTVTNPSDRETFAGLNAYFSVRADGNPTPDLQWQVNKGDGTGWVNLSGETGRKLTVSTDRSMNGYQYRAVASSPAGTATSDPATLTVLYAPAVTTDPMDQTVTEGADATFIAAADASPAASVQWQQYVSAQICLFGCHTIWVWQKIDGATGTSLTLNAVTQDMDGNQYRAVFTNSVFPWVATTRSATLHVTALTMVTPNVDDITVAQATCAVPTPSITFATVDGITYSTDPGSGYSAGQTVTVIATLASGYKFGALHDGWTAKDAHHAEYSLPLGPMPNCTAVPTTPTFADSTCTVDHKPTSPTASLPANGDHITYSWWFAPNNHGFQVKATMDPGYSWGDLTGTNWQDKGTDGSGNAVAAYHHTWGATPDCNVYVTPDVPQLSETCEVDGNGHQTGTVLDSVVLPTDTTDIHYADHNGTLFAVIQQTVKAYTYFKVLPQGWAFNDTKHQYLVFTPTYTNPTCLIDTAPVDPTVNPAVCNGPGTHSAATVIPADTKGVTYTVADDLSTVTATLDSGYQWQQDLPKGWTSGPSNTLVYNVTLIPAGACLVDATPLTPTAQAGTCDTSTGFDSPASITSPTDGLDEGGITYHVAGLTVTATADAGYQIPPTQGWVNAAGVWTYTASVTQPFCPSVIALPGSLPGTPDGTLDGVPGTSNPGQTFTATGTGFAPFATVNFGIYSTPLLLATVSADASGVAKATITIPADFTGNHTVVAAGTGSSGSPLYLAAGTTVVAKSTPTPSGSGSHGVGGVSTSRGPGVAPNGGSSSGLANTGARVNPIALTQIGLLALLAGGGLLVATRRRARKH